MEVLFFYAFKIDKETVSYRIILFAYGSKEKHKCNIYIYIYQMKWKHIFFNLFVLKKNDIKQNILFVFKKMDEILKAE